MKKILVLDACVRREESRTKKLMERALQVLREGHKDWEFQVLALMDMDLKYWNTQTLRARDALLAQRQYDAPAFSLGRQFREADGMIVAAPFWDLSVPAVLKVYIENVSAEGITFGCDENGMFGMCNAQWMLFLTTRGGVWEGSPMEQGGSYMKALCHFFGIDSYYHVFADGLDLQEMDGQAILEDALKRVEQVCGELSL